MRFIILDHANLSNADLSGTNVRQSTLIIAHFTGAILRSAKLPEANFRAIETGSRTVVKLVELLPQPD